MSTRKRIVIAGFGDTGLLVAIHLGGELDVVGVGPKPCLVSGQELGIRLTRPEAWKRDYLVGFDRYPALDRVQIVQGLIEAVDPKGREVTIRGADGAPVRLGYDVLVLSPGVTNGFWRNDRIEDRASIETAITEAADALAAARTIAVVGGGATGVGVAANLVDRDPKRDVHLFFSQSTPLPGYHPKVRRRLLRHLDREGVVLHPDHRARLPEGFDCDRFTREPVAFSTGQPAFEADLVVWAIGRTRPNTGFVPASMLDEAGFIRVDRHLRVEGHPDVFAVGDAVASDPHRSSARNWGYRIVAHNVRAYLDGREDAMKAFRAPPYRWGSILGMQPAGLRVFQAGGSSFRIPSWLVEHVLVPFTVRRMIYKGMRAPTSGDSGG